MFIQRLYWIFSLTKTSPAFGETVRALPESPAVLIPNPCGISFRSLVLFHTIVSFTVKNTCPVLVSYSSEGRNKNLYTFYRLLRFRYKTSCKIKARFIVSSFSVRNLVLSLPWSAVISTMHEVIFRKNKLFYTIISFQFYWEILQLL